MRQKEAEHAYTRKSMKLKCVCDIGPDANRGQAHKISQNTVNRLCVCVNQSRMGKAWNANIFTNLYCESERSLSCEKDCSSLSLSLFSLSLILSLIHSLSHSPLSWSSLTNSSLPISSSRSTLVNRRALFVSPLDSPWRLCALADSPPHLSR